jgi:hypothetical protein
MVKFFDEFLLWDGVISENVESSSVMKLGFGGFLGAFGGETGMG